MVTDAAGVPDDPGNAPNLDGAQTPDWRQIAHGMPVTIAVNDGTTVHGIIHGEWDNGDGTFSIEIAEDGPNVPVQIRRIPEANIVTVTSDSMGG